MSAIRGDKQEWYGAIGKDKGDLAGICTQGEVRAEYIRRVKARVSTIWKV